MRDGAARRAARARSVFYFTGGIVKRILNFGSPAPIDVEIIGYDLEDGAELRQAARRASCASVRDADGSALLTDVQISREENYPELDVVVDREKAGVLGVSEQQIAQTVLTSLVGNTQFSPIPFTDPKTGNEYFINVRLDDRFRSNVRDLARGLPAHARRRDWSRSTRSPTSSARAVRCIIDAQVPAAHRRRDGEHRARARTSAPRATRRRGCSTRCPPPDGFSVQLGGQTHAQKKAFTGLGFAALMALALVYMVLASQFKSLLDPLVIMFSVPLGVSRRVPDALRSRRPSLASTASWGSS